VRFQQTLSKTSLDYTSSLEQSTSRKQSWLHRVDTDASKAIVSEFQNSIPTITQSITHLFENKVA
jgi:hypothetical protein